MSTVDVALPVEVPGEDIANPPFAPVSALTAAAARWPESSAEFGGPLKHDGWVDSRPTWEDLTVAEAIAELRLGPASEYSTDFEADPHVMGDCPNCGPVPVHESGFCEWGCGYDFMSAARALPADDNAAARAAA